MAEAKLLISLPEEMTALVDEIIAERMKGVSRISIEHTPAELAAAQEIKDTEGIKAATKYLKSKERERIKEARRRNALPSRTAIVMEVLRYALPTYRTLTQ